MKLNEFFLIEGDPVFSPGNDYGKPEDVGQPEPEPQKRLQMLPPAVRTYVQEIERMCSKLVRHREGDPDLKEVVHKFLLELNKWMGEEGAQ